MNSLEERKLSSEQVYSGKILSLRVDKVILPDGREGQREVVDYSGAVAIVPVTAEREVILVRQFRYAVGETLLEIPAGKIESGEEPVECARRELLEETGYRADKMEKLCTIFTTPGFTTEKIHIFLATELTCESQSLDEDEFIDVLTVPLDRAVEMILSGEICDAKSAVGIFAALAAKKL